MLVAQLPDFPSFYVLVSNFFPIFRILSFSPVPYFPFLEVLVFYSSSLFHYSEEGFSQSCSKGTAINTTSGTIPTIGVDLPLSMEKVPRLLDSH